MEKTMNEVLAKARAAKQEKAKGRERYLTALECLEDRVRRLRLPAIQKNEGVHATLSAVERIRREIGGRK